MSATDQNSKSFLDGIIRRLRIPGSTADSRRRNLYTYVAIGFSGVLIFEAVCLQADLRDFPVAYFIVIASIAYFFNVTFTVLTIKQVEFTPNPIRLMRDTTASSVFLILSFALFYRTGEYLHTGEVNETAGVAILNSIYFSAVTFSTLGYGDIKPMGISKILSALEAILGNIHLAFIVSAAFAAIANKKES
ncbi:two pore domain potassium channel family protein [Paenirhodobacter populi]|nr:two pore domain potassium channel family protein [Sinirhodobacter populi]